MPYVPFNYPQACQSDVEVQTDNKKLLSFLRKDRGGVKSECDSKNVNHFESVTRYVEMTVLYAALSGMLFLDLKPPLALICAMARRFSVGSDKN
jgi:hypothetical protein